MKEVININENWYFIKNSDEITVKVPTDAAEIDLPHTWNATDGQDGGNDYFRGKCVYVKHLCKRDLPEASKYYIEFLGSNSVTDVYLNGIHITHHEGGYSAFRADLTPHMLKENSLTVVVDNSPSDTVYPAFADFTFYGGIYRDVNIICVGKTHFNLEYYGTPGLAVTPKITGNDADVEIRSFPEFTEYNQRLRYRITNREGRTVAEAITSVEDRTVKLHITDVHLWQGRLDPYLYIAEVAIMHGEEVVDSVHSRFGCRTFEIDPERGFILNGIEYPLRGVSRHQDREGIGNALLPEHHREDMALIAELGANTIRLAHYQHDRYFYDLCDRYGMIVWAEIPYISSHMSGGDENTKEQLTELIIQNYNHPSIFFWGLSNEITMNTKDDDAMVKNHKLLNDLAHSLDPTRKTAIACVSMCDTEHEYIKIPDVVAYNHYFGWYGGDCSMMGPWFDEFHEKHPRVPIGVSEYGCEALDWHSSTPEQGDYTEEYQAHFHEEMIRQLYKRKYLFATYVWNMFDFGADARAEGGKNGRNHKGLVTFDRKYKKDAFYAYKAWMSNDPFVHIAGKRYTERVEDPTRVTVYSNQPEVELFLNGVSIGLQKSDEHFFYFNVPNEGVSSIVVKAGVSTDSMDIRKVDAFPEKYRLREVGAVLNWFDITMPEGYLSVNDKISTITASEKGRRVFDSILHRLQKEAKKSDTPALELNDGMREMMGGFTLLRFTSLASMMNVRFTKEDLLDINKKLNKIPKE